MYQKRLENVVSSIVAICIHNYSLHIARVFIIDNHSHHKLTSWDFLFMRCWDDLNSNILCALADNGWLRDLDTLIIVNSPSNEFSMDHTFDPMRIKLLINSMSIKFDKPNYWEQEMIIDKEIDKIRGY